LRQNPVYSVLIPYVDFSTCSVTPKAEYYLDVETDHTIYIYMREETLM